MNAVKRHYWRFLGVFFALAVVLSLFQASYIYFNLLQFEKVKFESEKEALSLIVNDSKSISSVLYDVTINKPNVIAIFKHATSPDLNVKNQARANLYR